MGTWAGRYCKKDALRGCEGCIQIKYNKVQTKESPLRPDLKLRT